MSEWGLFLDRGSTPRSSTKSRTAERLRPVFLGSFKNSVGERKTETRKTQMSSRNGTHFKLRKRQGTKVLEISKMRVLN